VLDPKVADEIVTAWIAAAHFRNNTEMALSVPRREDLLALLEVAFLASIEREERCPIRPRLVFFPDATPSDLRQYGRGVDTLSFEAPIPLSPATLAKLAPAFDQDSSALAVAKQGDGVYGVVGALFYGRRITRLDSGQAARGRPQAFILNVGAPGSVTISFSDSVVGRFERGHLVRADPGPRASKVFTRHVKRTISSHAAHNHPDYWSLYGDCLERLYVSAARQGHGGTIVWCPSQQLPHVAANVRSSTQVTSHTSGHKLAHVLLQQQERTGASPFQSSPVIEDSLRRLAEFLDFTARLATVDGALVVDDELAPQQFRAHLAASRWEGRVLECAPYWSLKPQKVFDVSRFGTRHASAMALVGACPGVIAFVISEDGPVRTMMRADEDVVIWPDCLNTVFLD